MVVLIASSLNGWDHAIGTVTVHSYNESSFDEGEPRMGSGYDDKLKPVAEYEKPTGRGGGSSRRGAGESELDDGSDEGGEVIDEEEEAEAWGARWAF